MWIPHRKRPDDADESVAAVKDAVRNLAEVENRRIEVRKLGDAFRKVQVDNHFSDKIAIIMGGK